MKRSVRTRSPSLILSASPRAQRLSPAARSAGGRPPPMTELCSSFPKDTPREQVLASMQAFTAVARRRSATTATCQEGRGGRNDMASDEKPTKKAARGMMLLAREINASCRRRSAKSPTRPRASAARRAIAACRSRNRLPTSSPTRPRTGGATARARQVQGAARASSTAVRATTSARRPDCSSRSAPTPRTRPTMRWRI